MPEYVGNEKKHNGRNGYIDFIKFIMAIMLCFFHLGNGFMKGGRLAVEGFFMISGYLMAVSAFRDNNSPDNLGRETIGFVLHKYALIFPYLLVSSLLGFYIETITAPATGDVLFREFLLMLFEVVPLKITGLSAYSPVGIGWYISAMIVGAAVLFPFCRNYKHTFALAVCPLISIFGYGLLNHLFGNLAVTDWHPEAYMIQGGFIRGLAGLSAGVVLYETTQWLSKRKTGITGTAVLSVLEVIGFWFVYFVIQNEPKSKFEYLATFVIFWLLTIGISGKTFLSGILGKLNLKFFGTASTMIVLNHYYWARLFRTFFGTEYKYTGRVWYYYLAIAVSSVFVWFVGGLIRKLMKYLQRNFFVGDKT